MFTSKGCSRPAFTSARDDLDHCAEAQLCSAELVPAKKACPHCVVDTYKVDYSILNGPLNGACIELSFATQLGTLATGQCS